MLTVNYDKFDVHPGDRVLDLGCGFGRHTFEALKRGADVVTCDMAMPELVAVQNLTRSMVDIGELDGSLLNTSINGDATRLPYADESFDKIIASEILEHVPDDVAAYDELARILKPGGTLAVTVPAWLPEKICWKISDEYHAPFVEGGHVRIYTEKEIRTKLRGAGLDPAGSHHAHALHSPYWWLRCAVGPHNEIHENWAVKAYNKVLEWDIVKAPAITRLAEKALNPIIGKSLIVYANKSPLRSKKHKDITRAA